MSQHALLFTDVVDSTGLVERLGDEKAAAVWATHDRRARTLLARHRGREIDRTDGFFLLFDDVADAAGYAMAYHEALVDLSLGARVGIHVGPISLRENAPEDIARGAKRVEVEGLAKPIAARVMALAGGGQTLMSGAACNALEGSLPERGEIKRHGHYRLKGIEEPIEILELGARDRAAFFPPADTDKAYRVVRAGEFWCPAREVRHNLPAERDTFIGRTTELRALAARLDAGARLLSILGPGGTGKTRIVRRYGWLWLGDWPGGIHFCDLSDARSLDGVLGAVAFALEVPLGKDDPGVQLGHAIAGRGRCLVILDNFEQVVQHAQGTVGRWLERATEAVFVVTSRERLHLPGEESFPIEPLPLQLDAIELFTARARARKPDFVLGESNRAAVAEVVRLLDGLPLAIELAAARIGVLAPAQLVERLRDRFKLLAGSRGVAARQATLRAAIDWSWDLLASWEQAAFAQCAVFAGGFTLEAAEAVLDLAPWPEAPPAMHAVQALVDKSLLRTWIPAEQSRFDIDEPHFGMYISIHEYAAEKLAASTPGAQRAGEERHGRYFSGFGTDEAHDALFRQGGVHRRRALTLELDNLVTACRRAVSRGDGEVAVAAYRAAWDVLELQGPLALGVALGAQVLALPGIETALRVPAAATLAQALRRAGRIEEAGSWLAQALALARDSGNRRQEGNVLHSLANLQREQGRMTEARELFETALAFAREASDRRVEGSVLASLGLLHREQSRVDQAREHFDAALAIARETGDQREEGIVLGSLGLLHSEQGLVEEAGRQFAAAVAIARDMGDRTLEGVVLANLGHLQAEQGRREQALEYLEAALAIQRAVGNRRLEGIALGNLGSIHSEQGRKAAAQDHYAAALAIAREVGNRRHQGFILTSLGILRHDQGRLDEARADYDAALVMAREVGDHRVEGIALSRLGVLHSDQGRFAEARAHYEQALALAREAGYRRLEGAVLGGLGDLLVKQGQADAALELLRSGEALLRVVADREELAKLLCILGRAEVACGERARAGAALDEAETLAAAMGTTPDTDIGRELAVLRAALA